MRTGTTTLATVLTLGGMALSHAKPTQARSLRSMATDCVSLTSSDASSWDAVTACTDVYAAFTNGDKRILEDTAASIKAPTATAAVSSLEECATQCFDSKKCQFFKLTTTSPSTKTCTFYQHLAISARATPLSTASTSVYGFLLSGDPDFLNQNVDTSSSTGGSVSTLGGYSFYKTTDQSTKKPISMYIRNASDKCAAVPLTLYRAFANNYQSASMLAKVASGEIFNSMDAVFTQQKFLTALKSGTLTEFSVPTDAVDINARGDVVRTGKPGSTFTYKLDTFGRVVDVAAPMSYTNVLKKAGRRSANAAGTSIRTQYCNSGYQSRFNLIHDLSDATAMKMPFQAGHLVGCQFSNPSGFFNFVPQSVNSNSNNGCWYNSEMGTSRLLKMGCSGEYRARMTYFSQPGEISEVSRHTGPLLSTTEAAAFYTTPATTSSSSSLGVQRPCGYFHRPIKMSFDFTITGASADSRCSLVQDVLQDNGGKFFTTSPTSGAMQMTRAFAQWTFESNSFNRVRGLGVADFRANQCYTETGKLAPAITFGNELDRTFLKLKSSSSTAATTVAACLSASSQSNSLSVGACDTTGSSSRWTASAATLTLTSSGTKTSCFSLPSATSTGACQSATFQYIKPTVTFSGTKADITRGDSLVDGFVVVDDKCLVVGSSAKSPLSLVAMSSSASCSVFQATYTLDNGDVEGDDD